MLKRFLVTGGLTPDSPVAEHVRVHGDGIRDIAFIVDDVDAAYSAALERGATSFRSPVDDVDETGNGTIRHAAISTYGETVHTFLDRSRYEGPFAPQFEPSPLRSPAGAAVGIENPEMHYMQRRNQQQIQYEQRKAGVLQRRRDLVESLGKRCVGGHSRPYAMGADWPPQSGHMALKKH